MIGFEAASWLWLVVPAILAWWGFVRVQRRALAWLELHVAPRFRRSFTVYRPGTLALHMGLLLVMAAALAVAAAGPYAAGRTEAASATGRLLFLVDASSSMYAQDVEPVGSSRPRETDALRRIDVARSIAHDLMADLEGYRFALGSFSGTGAIHLPMTDNRSLVEDALRTLEVHSYYRNTGSSFGGALDLVPHFVDRRGYRLQVVLLSDGEQPTPEDYGGALAALAEQGVPVHTVAIGSSSGQTRRILDFQDVVEKKPDPRVLVEYTTRRVDEHLERISDATGGRFQIAEPGVARRLAATILEAGSEPQPFEHDAATQDLSARYLLIFLAGLLIDTLWFGRKPRPAVAAFDLDRLGAPHRGRPREARGRPESPRKGAFLGWIAAPMALAVLSACALPFGEERGGPRERAHRENERGIREDGLGRHAAARVHYERSRAFGVEPQIPAHNLARSVLLAGDYAEAHDLFQEALLLDPALSEAHFNDAMTLFLWGEAERDPRNCELERTRELWLQAQRRFSSAISAAAESEPRSGPDFADRARDNRRALADALEELERLIADPPEECLGGAGGGGGQQQESDGGGSAGSAGASGEGASGGGGQAEDEDQRPEGAGAQPQSGEAEPGDTETGGGGGGGGLDSSELEEVGRELERLAEQAREAGKFHRRTLAEQFRKEDWSNPDPAIWW